MEIFKQTSRALNTLPLSDEEIIEISQVAKEIPFDGLDDNDLLLIQTEHNMYSFSIADSALRRGLLMGGQMGEKGVTALLIGIDGDEPDRTASCSTKLFVGSRAIFIVSAKGGSPSKMVTSEIKSLTLIKAVLGETYM